MSPPPPATVQVPAVTRADPAFRRAPMSVSLHPAGSEKSTRDSIASITAVRNRQCAKSAGRRLRRIPGARTILSRCITLIPDWRHRDALNSFNDSPYEMGPVGGGERLLTHSGETI